MVPKSTKIRFRRRFYDQFLTDAGVIGRRSANSVECAVPPSARPTLRITLFCSVKSDGGY